jgi:hypothetical protein
LTSKLPSINLSLYIISWYRSYHLHIIKYICTYVHVAWLHLRMHVYIFIYIVIYIYKYLYIYIFIYFMYVYKHLHLWWIYVGRYMCACVCLQLLYRHVYIYIYACVGLHLYVYAEICVYTTRRHQAQFFPAFSLGWCWQSSRFSAFDSVESDWSSRFWHWSLVEKILKASEANTILG